MTKYVNTAAYDLAASPNLSSTITIDSWRWRYNDGRLFDASLNKRCLRPRSLSPTEARENRIKATGMQDLVFGLSRIVLGLCVA